MIKFFIIMTLVLGGILFIFANRFKGTTEYRENYFGMKIIFITYLIIGMMIIFHFEVSRIVGKNEEADWKKAYIEPYVEGYLIKNALWADKNGNIHYSTKKVRVEICNPKIVTASGGEITQIYFLDGEYAGYWGYTTENFLLK